MRSKKDNPYKTLRNVNDAVVLLLLLFFFFTSVLTLPSLFSKLLNTCSCRYEAGPECGKDISGLLSAELPGREGGEPNAQAAVSSRAKWSRFKSRLPDFGF